MNQTTDINETLAARLNPRLRPLQPRGSSTDINEILGAQQTLLPESQLKAVADFLSVLAGHSPYLLSLIKQDANAALQMFIRPPEALLAEMLADLRNAVMAAQSQPEIMELLRRMKRQAHLLIAFADIGRLWDVVKVTEAITQMADCAVSSAMAFLLKQAAAQGKLDLADLENPEAGSGVVILALGKHGSRELNYSSDVDLIVFFDPHSPAIISGIEPAPLFINITRSLVKILQERTGDGYVLRVDLRLRPDPGSTSVAMSLPSAFDYYESLGQNWERAAFIKARPIAGDLLIGERFIKDLAPFIWRRYFDYAAIADIHAMKRQIHAVRGHAEIAVAGHDVKLGRGGIREIEFFVQTQQLVFGGRRPNLRGARTIDMLSALHDDGWVTQDAVSQLTGSYKFLRFVEHRLQMMNDEQTQRLPSDPDVLAQFANFCGYANLSAFSKALTKYLTAVEYHYARLFEHAPGLDTATGSLVFTGTNDDPETIETLRSLGFSGPSRAIETIRGWHFGRRPAVQSARAREVLTELVPALIESFSGSGDPDTALLAFDHAMTRMPAAIELFSILKSNKAMRELFADVLGGAPRLADIIARRPHVLDAAIDPAVWNSSTGHIGARIHNLFPQNPATEDFLDSMRDLYQEEAFLIGVRLLSGHTPPHVAGHAYSDLATSIVQACLKIVLRDFSVDHGVLPGGRCAVFGLGKLGSREMTASSDLDLVFLYDYHEASAVSNGAKALHAAQYYARLAQRLISALTVSTRRGGLYEVDMRLRPSGRQGPIATRFSSFSEYQASEAETWEHMALTRARFLAGDETLGADANAKIKSILFRPRDPDVLAREVADMRAMIAQEKGDDDPWDLKLASGGIIDLEFIIQFLVLSIRQDDLHRLVFETPENIYRQAARLNRITRDDAETLAEAYIVFSAVTQMIRLTTNGGFNPGSAASGVLRRIASAVNLPEFRHVKAELDTRRRQVRGIFDKIVRKRSS